MKTTNKGFTLIEFLVLLAIVAIVLAMVAAFVNIFKFLFWVAVYFSIPAIIFAGLLKINQKYKWIVKGTYDRYLYDGVYIDNDLVWILMFVYFVAWPIFIPGVIVWITCKELYHRYIKTMIYNLYKKKGGFFRIPTIYDKEQKNK